MATKITLAANHGNDNTTTQISSSTHLPSSSTSLLCNLPHYASARCLWSHISHWLGFPPFLASPISIIPGWSFCPNLVLSNPAPPHVSSPPWWSSHWHGYLGGALFHTAACRCCFLVWPSMFFSFPPILHSAPIELAWFCGAVLHTPPDDVLAASCLAVGSYWSNLGLVDLGLSFSK